MPQFETHRRIFLLSIAVAIGCVATRVAYLQTVDFAHFEAASRANRIRLLPVDAPRGLIVDRNGIVIARSRPSYVCTIIPSEVRDIASTMDELAAVLRTPVAALERRMLHHQGNVYANFQALLASEPFTPIPVARNLTTTQVARLEESLDTLTGVDVEAQAVRDYPFSGVGSHLLGYVGAITPEEYRAHEHSGYYVDDLIGKDGLELQYDRYLHGQHGGRQILVDAQGRPVQELARRPSMPGARLELTLDWRLQRIVETSLHRQLEHWSAKTHRRLAGAIVVLDVRNGEVLALASQPNFNPNAFAAGINQKHFDAYLDDSMHPLYDRAIAAATAVGSTFKLVTGAAAITLHLIDPKRVVFDTGRYACHGVMFEDVAGGGLGRINFTQALAGSSDGYFYHVADLIGHPRLRQAALAFGLGAASGIDLPGEFAGLWPTNAWSMQTYHVPLEPSDVCQLGIGQGAMEATPLQMADVTSIVANGGDLYRPHILRDIVWPNGRIEEQKNAELIRHVPISGEALAAVRNGMAAVTGPRGTAAGYQLAELPFAGKTGTVETDGGHGPNTTWFVAYAPLQRPEIALAVYMERTGNYGSQVALPVARQILSGYAGLRSSTARTRASANGNWVKR